MSFLYDRRLTIEIVVITQGLFAKYLNKAVSKSDINNIIIINQFIQCVPSVSKCIFTKKWMAF